jgi:hypothetical protein
VDNQLTSLEGAPRSIANDFVCENNRLTSLEGAPQSVGWNFDCGSNQLTSLDGAPRSVIGSFNCEKNQLTSLEGAPQHVEGVSDFGNNPVTEETLDMIYGRMKEGDGYLVALSVLKDKIPDADWDKLQKPDDVDFGVIKNARSFGII